MGAAEPAVGGAAAMSVLVVTGTSTGVGKTVVTAALAAALAARGLRVGVVKPAQTGVLDGEPGDLAEVRRLAGCANLVELARYPDPLAPDTAARRSGRPMLRLEQAVGAVRELASTMDVVLVEGAGGVLVRLGADGFTLRDLAVALDAPVVVVCAAGLGTLNHSELTVEALRARGIVCAGLIIGSWPELPDLAERCNVDDLARVTGVPVVGKVPAGSAGLDPGVFQRLAPGWIVDSVNEELLKLGNTAQSRAAARCAGNQYEESNR